MFQSVVYHGNSLLGEVEIYPQNAKTELWNKEIRISHFSPASERCPPLAVLHTIAAYGVCFKMVSKSILQSEESSPLLALHRVCLEENKTAVMTSGEGELHLVAMCSRKNMEHVSCFWGFTVRQGLYNSCLVMLNLRCLGIVFDLDETLIVANTMRSFEDRIDALQRKLINEGDPLRIAGMLAEVKRYQDDKAILKQYAENDEVIENGRVIKVQSEIVPALSENHPQMSRPLIRLQEKNIILTRINPAIRDTSVLVRLRPAWEDLRSYLTARGRKRFEVYVCTMAERDYALEMWRLLDPESSLINPNELLDRIVCVKSGMRKSLLDVFNVGICHPKMALVIDDRLKVWEDMDQPRVHVVPAFAPYYAPQAEANNAVPVLCVARNVACNVRGGFFKEFDETLLQRIAGVCHEDDVTDLPASPDVSNYLISEDDASVLNGNKDPLCSDAMTDAEAERRMKDANGTIQAVSGASVNLDPRISVQHIFTASLSTALQSISQGPMPLQNMQFPQATASLKELGPVGAAAVSEPSLHGSPAREEGEVPESELDPDTRRRLLILQHGQDTREHATNDPQFPIHPTLQIPMPPISSRGDFFPLEDDISRRKLNRPKEFPIPVLFDRHRPPPPFYHENQGLPKEIHHSDSQLRSSRSFPSQHSFPGEEMPLGQVSSSNVDLHFDSGRPTMQYPETSAGVLQEIAMKCGAKVEFRHALAVTTELQFSIEVWLTGEKIGEGIAKTRKEAQRLAAEISLRNLANRYLSCISPDFSPEYGDLNKRSYATDNGSLLDSNSFGYQTLSNQEPFPATSASQQSKFLDERLEGSKKLFAPVSSLKELCTVEGLNLVFKAQSPLPAGSNHQGEVCAQVEVGGEIVGKGVGLTWEEAKSQAAEEALERVTSNLNQNSQEQLDPPRTLQAISNKRLKPDVPRMWQRLQPSSRYSKSGPPVP